MFAASPVRKRQPSSGKGVFIEVKYIRLDLLAIAGVSVSSKLTEMTRYSLPGFLFTDGRALASPPWRKLHSFVQL